MKRATGIGLIITLLTGILAASTGCGNSVVQTTLTTADFGGVNTGSTKSTQGLILSLALDAKIYKPGDTVNMIVSERNTLAKTNKVLAAKKWPVSGLTLDLCGAGIFPFGIAVFQGNYSTKEVSKVESLDLYNPNIITFGCVPRIVNIGTYTFNSASGVAIIKGSNPDETQTTEMGANFGIWSFWAGSRPNATQTNFTPGIYTVVAGDEWGALVVDHFTVTE